jgi:hypothetical protein
VEDIITIAGVMVVTATACSATGSSGQTNPPPTIPKDTD